MTDRTTCQKAFGGNDCSMLQCTLKEDVVLEGIALHTGVHSRITIQPAPPDTGVVFRHMDVDIPAEISRVSATARNTELSRNGITIYTVEHVLAALSGLGVDNAIVEMTAPEPPVMDGSALVFVEAIRSAGIAKTYSPRRVRVLREPFAVGHGASCVSCVPAEKFGVSFLLEYKHKMIGYQAISFDGSEESFIEDFAPARTFGLIEEVEALSKAGLAKGGSAENAVIVYPDRYSSALRYYDEFVRHKVLDMIGDISLAGALPMAHFTGVRSGHRLNADAVRRFIELSEFAD